MTTNYVQHGSVIDVTAQSDVNSGDVLVLGHLLGVALADIATGEVGAVAIEDVYELPKASGAVFAVGEKLLWDVSAGEFDDSSATPQSGDVLGAAVAVKPGLDGETTCWAKLTPNNADVTP